MSNKKLARSEEWPPGQVTGSFVMVESNHQTRPPSRGPTILHIERIQIRRHGGHIGVPEKACGSWTLFLCKKISFVPLNFHRPRERIRSKNTLALSAGWTRSRRDIQSMRECCWLRQKAILCRRLHYCLHFCSLAYEFTHRRRQRIRKWIHNLKELVNLSNFCN